MVEEDKQLFDIHKRLAPGPVAEIHDEVVLDHLQRDRGRLKVEARSGAQLRIFLERGKALGVGEVLQSDCGRNFQVVAALETVIRARADDWLVFSRACYHLGNRHVKLQVGECWLRISPDHVLEQMLQQLGLRTEPEQAAFVPESGAYAGGVHEHHHH